MDEVIMRPVAHLANLDLNLLVALRELMRERSVTRAAQRLGVTQPAASAALAAGWVTPSRCAARVTFRSRTSSRSATSRFRSRLAR